MSCIVWRICDVLYLSSRMQKRTCICIHDVLWMTDQTNSNCAKFYQNRVAWLIYSRKINVSLIRFYNLYTRFCGNFQSRCAKRPDTAIPRTRPEEIRAELRVPKDRYLCESEFKPVQRMHQMARRKGKTGNKSREYWKYNVAQKNNRSGL